MGNGKTIESAVEVNEAMIKDAKVIGKRLQICSIFLGDEKKENSRLQQFKKRIHLFWQAGTPFNIFPSQIIRLGKVPSPKLFKPITRDNKRRWPLLEIKNKGKKH